MTFEQWQATRRECVDLRPYTQEDYVQVGYVYDGERWIASFERDGVTCYHTIIGNAEPASRTLADVERELYDWCKSDYDE